MEKSREERSVSTPSIDDHQETYILAVEENFHVHIRQDCESFQLGPPKAFMDLHEAYKILHADYVASIVER